MRQKLHQRRESTSDNYHRGKLIRLARIGIGDAFHLVINQDHKMPGTSSDTTKQWKSIWGKRNMKARALSSLSCWKAQVRTRRWAIRKRWNWPWLVEPPQKSLSSTAPEPPPWTQRAIYIRFNVPSWKLKWMFIKTTRTLLVVLSFERRPSASPLPSMHTNVKGIKSTHVINN